VGAFVLHDLEDAAAVDLPYVLLLQLLVERGGVERIGLLPFQLVLVQPEGICENLLAEGALVLEMFVFDLFVMLLKVGVLDLFLVCHGLQVQGLAGLSHCALIGFVGLIDFGDHSGLAQVVQELHTQQHGLNINCAQINTSERIWVGAG
jgi:hypothetical protein